MKIGGRIVDAYMRTSVVGATPPAEKLKGTSSTQTGPTAAAEVNISEAARARMAQAAAPVDTAKVTALKQSIAENRFQVDPFVVARGIVENMM